MRRRNLHLIPAIRYKGETYRGRHGKTHGHIDIPFNPEHENREDRGFIDERTGKWLSRREAGDYVVRFLGAEPAPYPKYELHAAGLNQIRKAVRRGGTAEGLVHVQSYVRRRPR